MAKEKRNFFQRLISGIPFNKANNINLYKVISGYNATFSTISGEFVDNDVIIACIDTIATHCAKFEPKHFKEKNGTRTRVKGDIDFLLNNQPNPIMTTFDFIYKIISILFIHNNCFVYIDKDKTGMITGFYPVNYATSDFARDASNNLYIKFYLMNGKEYILPYDDIIHLRRFYNSNDLLGSSNSVLDGAIQNQVTAEEGIANAIKTSNALRGIIEISQNIKEADIKKFKNEFVKAFIEENDSGIAAIDSRGKFHEINMKPITLDKDQLDHVNQRVLNYFRINKSILSGEFSPEQWNAFYESTLEPLAIYLSQSFKSKIFTKKAIKDGNTIDFTVNRVQYASLDQKIKMVKEIGAMGILTVDTALSILDLPQIGGEEGSKRMQSLNYINSAIADDYQLNKKKNQKGSENNE